MRKSTREKIIDEAQVECHSARSDVVEARLKLNSVPRPVREGFQRTVLSYYDALRPLRTEGVVNSWWESVTLSEDWIEGIVFETESGEQISVSREKARRILNNDEPYEFVGSMVHQGLDTLESLDDATEETTSVVTGMRGRREETTTRPVVLEAGVLVDISRVLDEAATKLGFAPDIDLQDAEAGVV
ncbi:hypothetical protein [Halogeometricum limi]|nr:hypothetical protein [Halogeometricum limi]